MEQSQKELQITSITIRQRSKKSLLNTPHTISTTIAWGYFDNVYLVFAPVNENQIHS